MGKGANLLNINGILGNLSDEIQITDYWYKWDCTSSDGHLTIPSGTNYSYSSNGLRVVNRSSGTSSGTFDITLPDDCEVEFTMSYENIFRLLLQVGGFSSYWSANDNKLRLVDNNDPNAWANRTEINMSTFPTEATFIIKNQNNIGSIFYNTQVIGSKNLLNNNKILSFEINSNFFNLDPYFFS